MPKLLWIDLETTGLDPNKNKILEVAALSADLNDPLKTKLIVNSVVRTPFPMVFEEGVSEMHRLSGLLDDLEKDEGYPLSVIEKVILDFVPETQDNEEKTILAGSSVQFDRGFINVHMPTLFHRLSYRNYDARGIQLFCRGLGMPKMPKGGAHRALADITESVEAVRECMRWLQTPSFRDRLAHLLKGP